MSDYHAVTYLSRDQIATALAGNPEHFVYVLTSAISHVDWRDALDHADLADDADRDDVLERLENLLKLIEDGEIE